MMSPGHRGVGVSAWRSYSPIVRYPQDGVNGDRNLTPFSPVDTGSVSCFADSWETAARPHRRRVPQHHGFWSPGPDPSGCGQRPETQLQEHPHSAHDYLTPPATLVVGPTNERLSRGVDRFSGSGHSLDAPRVADLPTSVGSARRWMTSRPDVSSSKSKWVSGRND
jgi:hypothetical protein